MKISFLGQGIEPESANSVGNHLLDFFSRKIFHTFTGISAFASEAGVAGLADKIKLAKGYFKHINLIVGIDEEGTSKEALEEILSLDISSYVFHQEESPIFHPKIYLFEGSKDVKLIIGSSNLTAKGLFVNVESSLLVEFSSTDSEGKALLASLKNYYSGLFKFTDPNLFKLSDRVIESLIEKGIVPNETVRAKRHGKKPSPGKGVSGASDFIIPKRSTAKIPHTFRGKPKSSKQLAKVLKELEISEAGQIEPDTLVWQKRNLPSSDAQQVNGGTNVTGVLRLGDARFKLGGNKIDRNTYFRNEVFGNLRWASEPRKNNSPLQIAKFSADISIGGKSLGTVELKISHDPDRIADQDNVPTTIHWGSKIIDYLKKNSVVGKTLSLFSPQESGEYRIVIE